MAPSNAQKWDEKVHEDILLEIFRCVSFPATEVQKLMAGLREKGYTFTESALRYDLPLPPYCLPLLQVTRLSPFAPFSLA